LTVPIEDVIAYPKVSKAYFSFVEIFFRNHIATVMALDTAVLMQLMNAVHEGLQASEPTLSSLCANAIDHLATFYFENKGKDKAEMHNLNKVRL
jgi:exportin-7